MPLITPTQLREHTETDLSDDALLRIIASEEAEIVRRYGPHDTAAETVRGGAYQLVLNRAAQSVTMVTEYWGGQAFEVLADEYRVVSGGYVLERVAGVWPAVVDVEYLPVDTSPQRTRVLIDLCKLALQYNATTFEGVGDYRTRSVGYTSEREKLLRQAAAFGGMVLA